MIISRVYHLKKLYRLNYKDLEISLFEVCKPIFTQSKPMATVLRRSMDEECHVTRLSKKNCSKCEEEAMYFWYSLSLSNFLLTYLLTPQLYSPWRILASSAKQPQLFLSSAFNFQFFISIFKKFPTSSVYRFLWRPNFLFPSTFAL